MACSQITVLKGRGILRDIKNNCTVKGLATFLLQDILPENHYEAMKNWLYTEDGTTIDPNLNFLVTLFQKKDKEFGSTGTLQDLANILLTEADATFIPSAGEDSSESSPKEVEYVSENTDESTSKIVIDTLEKSVDNVFGNYTLLENYRLNNFRIAIMTSMSYFKKNNGHVFEISNNSELNSAIASFKESQFKVLVSFINSNLPDSDKISEKVTLYDKDGIFNTKAFKEVLTKFEILVNNSTVTPDAISDWWENDYFGESEDNMWNAANAYLNLKHFDESLAQSKLDKTIKITFSKNIETNLRSLSNAPVIKYSMGKDNSHLVKNWNIGEYRNAIKENSVLAGLVIDSIEKYKYDVNGQHHEKIIGKLSISEIANAWSHFIESVRSLYNIDTSVKDLYINHILKISEDPQLHIKAALDILFKANKDLRNSLLAIGNSNMGTFNLEDLNILYSVYNAEIRSTSKRNTAENNTLKARAVQDFLKSEIIYGIIRKNNSVNYLVTVYEDGEYITKNLAKSDQILRKKFNFLKGANSELAMSLPQNLKQRLSKFGIERVPSSIPGTYETNQLYINLGGERMRMVLTKGDKSLATSNATYNFHIIPDINPELVSKLKSILDPVYYSAIDLNPYSRTIKDAINNTSLSSDEKKELLNSLKNPYDDLLTSTSFGSETRKKILDKDDSTAKIREILDFIDTIIKGLNLQSEEGLLTLNRLREFGSSTNTTTGEKIESSEKGVTLRQIMSEAAMLSYKMSLLAECPEGEDLARFVTSQDKDISQKANEGKIFRLKEGKYCFQALSNSSWLESFFSAQALVDGNSTRSVTKGRDGNNKANYVPASLSDHIYEQYQDRLQYAESHPESPLASNLIIRTPGLLSSISRDASFASMFGDEKNTKTATPAELIYHGIVNNFFNSFLSNDTFGIQPTVYSDKTAFINFMINAQTKVLNNKTLWELNNSEYEQLFEASIKSYYEAQNKNVVNKFTKFFNFFKNNLNLIEDPYVQYNIQEGNISSRVGINNILKSLTSSNLEDLIRAYNANNTEKINITLDSDYRNNKGKLCLNELSTYYASKSFNVKERFKKEKYNFVKGLFRNKVQFIYDKNSPLYQLIHKNGKSPVPNVEVFEKEWISYGNLVIAKKADGTSIFNINDIQAGEDIVLNPLLNKYFYIDTICSSNIKYSLVGNEISDPLKAGLNMEKDFNIADPKNSDNTSKTIEDINQLKKLTLEDYEILKNIDLATLGFIISGEDTNPIYRNIANNAYVRKMYDKLIYRCISTSEGSQYKRNVIIPGSGTYYKLNSLSGIGQTTKVAFMEDPQSEVFNVSGYRSDGEDAQDGSAQQCALTAILENGSLNVDSVGYRYKKPLWYYYDDETGCSGLMKYAVHTIHNDVMNNSSKSSTNLNKLWKKMTNIKWDQEYDLCNSCGTAFNGKLDFNEVISFCKDDSGNKTGLAYKDIDTVYKILDFKRTEDGKYYTIEEDTNGNITIVLHTFDANDNDIKIRSNKLTKTDKNYNNKVLEFLNRASKISDDNNYHNINSLYQLHLALGGIYSVLQTEQGNWIPSESSNYATVAFMNNVSILKDEYYDITTENDKVVKVPKKNIPKTLDAYRQPLKEFLIGYAALKTSNKRHTTNINSTDVLRNDKDLLYTEISNKGQCIQQDPTHTADEAELTEMSQVIASLDVGGKLHDYAAEAYKGLSKLIIDKLGLKEAILLEYQDKNLDDKKRLEVTEKLYDIIVREFLDNYQARSQTDLAASIVKQIKANFGTDALFQDADFKLPISDPNIFRQIVSSFISDINSALKRKYSGIGDVMTPGFDQFQIFRLKENNGNDSDMLFDDVYNKALPTINRYIKTNYNPVTIANSAVSYLKNWNGGLDTAHASNAWFFTTQPNFEFNSNAIGEERYGGFRGFELVQHTDNPYEYEVHFKGDLNNPFTALEKATYFAAIREFLKAKQLENPNQKITLTLTGEVSKGGFSGYNKLHDYGFIETGKYRPVAVKDLSTRDEVLNRWKTFKNPISYLNEIENNNDKLTVINDWNSKIFRETDLNNDILAPEFELDLEADTSKVQLKAFGSNANEIRTNIVNMYLQIELERVDESGNKVYYKEINEFDPCDLIIVTDVYDEEVKLDLFNIDTYFNVKTYLYFNKDATKKSLETYLYNIQNSQADINGNVPTVYTLLENPDIVQSIVETFNIPNSKSLPAKTLIKLILSDNLNAKLDIAKPSNLKPQLISFKLKDGRKYNLYDLDEIRNKHKKQGSRKNAEYDPNVDIAIENLIKNHIVNINGVSYEVDPDSVVNKEAEALMTNIHESDFLQNSYSLYQQLNNFNTKSIKDINSNDCDIMLMGRHATGISFNKSNEINSDLTIQEIPEYRSVEGNDILIYAKDNKTLEKTFLMGWYKPEKQYRVQKRVFENITEYQIIDKNGNIVEDNSLLIFNGKVYRKEYLINKYVGITDSLKDYKIININLDKVVEFLSRNGNRVSNENIEEFNADIINGIAKNSKATHLQLTKTLKNPLFAKTYASVLSKLKKFGSANVFWNESLNTNIEFLNLVVEKNVNLDSITIEGKNYLRKLSLDFNKFKREILSSHNLSRFFVAARIPAQSLLSYMKMRCVGYLQGTDNQVIVSHFQTWLQGSDYDIDKAYMMSYSFDENGKFIGWSDVFNYSSPEALLKSLLLPVPKGYKFSSNSNAIDINEDLKIIGNLKNTGNILYLLYLSNLILQLEKNVNNDIIEIAPVDLKDEDIKIAFNLLRTHENTDIPILNKEKAIQNSVSARILQIANAPENAQLAYSPITMKKLLDIANTSPKGNMVQELTGMNPLTKYIMQCQNMIGKNVISIAAVGEKVFMGLSFYFNELSRSKNENDRKKMMFTAKTTRILNRSKGAPTPEIKTTIADVNWNSEEIMRSIGLFVKLKEQYPNLSEELLLEKMQNVNHTDLLISQLLSAATDNAKELILDKINSGLDTANIYIHLLVMGYSMDDIASFMIGPAASLVSDIMNSNIYNPYYLEITVLEAINIAMNGYSFDTFMDKSAYVDYGDDQANSLLELYAEEYGISIKLIDSISGKLSKSLNLETFNDKKVTSKNIGTAIYASINKNNYLEMRLKFIEYLESPDTVYSPKSWLNAKYKKMVYDFYMSTEALALLRESYLADDKFVKTYEDMVLDLAELNEIKTAAMETTTLGTLFGLNKEVKPEVSEILYKINSIESTVDLHLSQLKDYYEGKPEAKLKIIQKLAQSTNYEATDIVTILDRGAEIFKEGFSFEQFASRTQIKIQGMDYRQVAIDMYDLVKSQYNILDVMSKHPQYCAAMETWIVGHQLLRISSAKAGLSDIIRADLKLNKVKLDQKQFNGLLNYSENLIITKWMLGQNILFPVVNGQTYIGTNYETETYKGNDTLMTIRTATDAASYKMWFELYLIPLMITGEVNIPGKGTYKISSNNAFVKALIYGEEHHKPVYRLNLLMDLISENPNAAKTYLKCVKDLKNLPKEILDYIMLYNILVVHNAPGNDRFSNVFSGLIGNDTILDDYLKFVGELDFSLKNTSLENQRAFLNDELGYTLEDAEFSIAPEFRDGQIPSGIKASLIIIKKRNGDRVYRKYNTSDRKWEDYTGYAFYGANIDLTQKLDRMFNYVNYGILYSPLAFNKDVVKSILGNKKIKELSKMLIDLINQLKLIIERIC